VKAFSVLRLLITTGLVTTSLATTDRVGASPTSTDTSSAARADTELLAVTRLLESAQSTTEAAFEYEADRFIDHVDGDSLVLEGHAVVLHKGARLEADRMVFFRDRHVIVATSTSRASEQDSSRRTVDQVAGPADSSRLGLDSTAQQGPGTRPRLSRGDDVLEGDVILYDTETGEGWITDGRIAHDDGFFAGRRIRALSDEEFLVGSGSYTTCDDDDPHFDFYSPRIKVLVGDMAIARPVYFRIAESRLLWIPFYVFSLREDRQSGVLTPGFGRRPLSFGSTTTEWEVRNLGYYFAPSDYWDLTLAADLRQQTGWVGRGALSYAWRYRFNGSIQANVQNRQDGDVGQRAWSLSLRHRQQLGSSASLQGSGTFQGKQDFLRDNGTGLDDRLNRTLRSNVRYDKRWREAGWSLSAGASQTKNLDLDRSDLVLPEISLRASRKALFGDAGRNGPWYTRFYYDGNARMRNTRQTTATSQTDRTRADASLGLSTQQRPADWLNLNASFNSGWRDQNLRSRSEEGVRSDQLSTSATVSQTVYGLFHPRVGRVTSLRHVLKPDVGFNFGATRSDTGGVGFTGRGGTWKANRRLTLRLSNSLWVKYLQNDEEEAKARLAQLNLSTSYDFDRDRRPLSDLVTSFTVEAGRRLNSRLSLRSEFYDDEDDLLTLPRLRQFEVTTTLRTLRDNRQSGRSRSGSSQGGSQNRSSSSSYQERFGNDRSDGFGYENGLQQDIDARDRGRTFHTSHYYSRRRSAAGTSERSWIRGSLGMTLSQIWHVNYSINYNLHAPGVALGHRDRITAELLSVQREFHDWTATLNVEPSGLVDNRAFYFKAQFKEIPQLRLERGDRRRIGS
jgi:hypothetical protein